MTKQQGVTWPDNCTIPRVESRTKEKSNGRPQAWRDGRNRSREDICWLRDLHDPLSDCDHRCSDSSGTGRRLSRRTALLGIGAFGLAACSAPVVWAPDAEVARAFAPQVGSPYITLYTMKNTSSDNGAHSALMINASQRVIFDPAGSFQIQTLPERNDVVFGMTPQMEAYYVSYHARETFYVVGQKFLVSQDVAEQALALSLANGPVPKAGCTMATSRLMSKLPGFQSIRSTFFPDNLQQSVARLPGVETTIYREDDGDDKSVAAREINAEIRAAQSE